MTIRCKTTLALAAFALAAAAQAQNSNQGVSKNEIVLGSIQDLSGPIAGFGKQVRLGMLLRVDEINEQGGVHGRKIKLVVEDSAYDPKKAVLAAQKLVNQDKIFAMIGHIGTAQNMAAMPVQFEKNVINFAPTTAAREMYEPTHRLKYATLSSYYDQVRLTLPVLASAIRGTRRSTTCSMTSRTMVVRRSTSSMGHSKSSSSCTCRIMWAAKPSSSRRRLTRAMAILMMSAAVPCMGWFMAVRSPKPRSCGFLALSSGIWRLRPYMVSA